MGRFLGRDPKEELAGLNLYAFVHNNPINRWDYLGMTDCGQQDDDGYGGDGDDTDALLGWIEGNNEEAQRQATASRDSQEIQNALDNGKTVQVTDPDGNVLYTFTPDPSKTSPLPLPDSDSLGFNSTITSTSVYINGAPDPNSSATATETTTNWSKGIVGVTNVVRSGVKIVTGVQQIVAGVPVVVAGHATGTVTPWSLVAEAGGYTLIANGAKDVFGGAFLAKRGITQIGEARNADTSWEWQNFAGLLPFGGSYDDPGETKKAMEKIKEMPWWQKLGELCTGP